MDIMTEVGTAFVCSGHSENMVSGKLSPGVLVFSRSLQLQYVNRRALELIRNIGQAIPCRSKVQVIRSFTIFGFCASVADKQVPVRQDCTSKVDFDAMAVGLSDRPVFACYSSLRFPSVDPRM